MTGMQRAPPKRRSANSVRTASEASEMEMPGGGRVTDVCDTKNTCNRHACEQLRLERVRRNDERLRQQLLLESLDELGGAVAPAVVAQHWVANISQLGIDGSRALQQIRDSSQKVVV